MNNKNHLIGNSSFYINVTNKIISFILFVTSVSFFLILFSFHPEDSGWGVFSENNPQNYYGATGAFLSGLVIREFGLLPGLFFLAVLFIWSLKFFNGSKINYFKIKILTIVLMIFFSSLGGSYLETYLIEQLNSTFPIISQNGLPEWFLLIFTNKISDLLDVNIDLISLILGFTSVFISTALFIWISSISSKEINFFKFISRPIILPIFWILTIFFNLFFYNKKNILDENKKQKFKFNFIQTLIKSFLQFKIQYISRKKPQVRKSPILIKNIDKKVNSKQKREKNISFQDDLPFGSESGFILPSINLLRDYTEDIKPPSKETLDMNAKVLEGVLSDYSINGNIESVRYGPVVTRYDLQPAPGLRSQRVISLADDIARSMSVEAVRVAMVPGQNVIGIELPNKTRETVILRNILEHQEFQNSNFSLPVCLGKILQVFQL